MLSKTTVKIINIFPDAFLVKIIRTILKRYLKKYAHINISGLENIDKIKGPKIFICNHLSNADGLVLDKVFKEKYDPIFVAGEKLANDPVTRLGTQVVRNISIKPNSADKEALTKIINAVKNGNNLLIFPEGTRSRTGSMIEGKKGILLIAKLTKAPMIPIGIWGTEKLLPIDKSGNMAKEKFNEAEVNINIGEGIYIPNKKLGESKQDYENRSMNYIMKSIAALLKEEYRGVYK
ncbi:lysophospholipid acyltransferase family protein [Clostridium carnis]